MISDRISRLECNFAIASVIAQRGTCSRLYVGAVAVRDGQLLAAGYNGAPAGMSHCVHTDDSPCTRAVHAEVNVIASAAKHGVCLNEAELFITHSPCLSCAGLIINAGIYAVHYRHEFRDMSGVRLLLEAGVEVSP